MLAEITYRGFRNLVDGSWRPGEGAHLLVGPNGAGKTSLLEAVYLLSTSRSFRTARTADCCRHGEQELSLFGRVANGDRGELEIRWSGEGLERRLNGKTASLTDYLAMLPVVVWSAATARLIDGGPEMRRRFLDQGVVGSGPAALSVLTRYRRTLEQKRELLKSGAQGLAAWNEVLAESAERLIRLRHEYTAELEEAFAQLVRESELELPALQVRYRPSIVSERVRATLAKLERREREAGRPLLGPHRDELELLWGGHEVRRVSSAGERKAFGLLLTAARARVLAAHGRAPLLLLDDLDAELDDRRLAKLWSVFRDRRQILVTTTRGNLAGRLAGLTEWRLTGGALRSSGEVKNTTLNS